MANWELQLEDLVESTRQHLSDMLPSEWYEKNMVMPQGSAFPGNFNYDITPYWREVIDCGWKNSPIREISIMAGAQTGKTAAVLNPMVGYTISQNPGNIMFLTGHSELSEAAMVKIDHMIDNCGLRPLIKPNIMRVRNSRSGDTNKQKEFLGGDLKAGSATNHNLVGRQHDVMIMIVDDYDAAPIFQKNSGSTRGVLQKRTTAFAFKKKIFYCTSPERAGLSNIEITFNLSDKRFYNVPCPCCHEMITLEWDIKIDEKENAGIFWKLDNLGRVDKKSVGYICQKCARFFKSKHKFEMNINGIWVPTAVPIEENHAGFNINSLYSPAGMDDWDHYAVKFHENNPIGGKRNEKEHQTFVNTTLAQVYSQEGEAPEAKGLQRNNVRPYKIGVIPEELSKADGNGEIVMLTWAADANGKLNDARLDWEIVAHSEGGQEYSMCHGSEGSFIFRETDKQKETPREHWSYEMGVTNSLWPLVDKILGAEYRTESGRIMKIAVGAIDTGHCEDQVFNYIDTRQGQFTLIGLKGDKEHDWQKYNKDVKDFVRGKSRPNLYLLNVNKMKDDLARKMTLVWDEDNKQPQPLGFLNFPHRSGDFYSPKHYFDHYEAEHKILDTDSSGTATGWKWVKKNSIVQNHFWDVKLYNRAACDIFMWLICTQELKIKDYNWKLFVDILMGRYGK